MLRYELMVEDDGILVYAYYPECSLDDCGYVAFFPDGSRAVLEVATADKEGVGWYKLHALSGIPDDGFEERGMVAWY